MFFNFPEGLGVKPEEVDTCMAWAFGPDWPSFECFSNHHVWNARHGDLFMIRGYDPVEDTFFKIGQAWRKYGSNTPGPSA